MTANQNNKIPSDHPVAFLAKRLLQLTREALEEELRPHGVTSAQMHVLAVLDREPGISGAKLARNCMVTPQTTQVLLRGIEAKGWIARRKHPENERILLATLTKDGRGALAQSRAVFGRIYGKMLGGFAPPEIEMLEALLCRCVVSLETPREAIATDQKSDSAIR